METLALSFYIDNCVYSLDDYEKGNQFIKVATEIMDERKFEPRGWELTLSSLTMVKSKVLGLL